MFLGRFLRPYLRFTGSFLLLFAVCLFSFAFHFYLYYLGNKVAGVVMGIVLWSSSIFPVLCGNGTGSSIYSSVVFNISYILKNFSLNTTCTVLVEHLDQSIPWKLLPFLVTIYLQSLDLLGFHSCVHILTCG